MLDLRQGVVVSNTNLVDTKKEVPFPWRGLMVIVFITLAIWAGSYLLSDLNKKEVNKIQNSLNSLKSSRDYEKIAFVADVESRLQSVGKIVEERTNWDNFFLKLEQNTMPEVVFENMEAKKVDNSSQMIVGNLDSNSKSNYSIILKGRTVGLDNLAKQVAAMKEGGDNAFAKDVKIQNIDIKNSDSGTLDVSGDATLMTDQSGGKGSVEFSLEIEINPTILKTVVSPSNSMPGGSQ